MTDTTTSSVYVQPRSRWWAWAIAAVAVVFLTVLAISAVIPSEIVATAENPRLQEEQPAPYARVPASAESVNDRVVYSDLPEDVVVYETSEDFFFVTVSAPAQSVLSWVIGSTESVVDPLTEEGKFGRRTPTQNRQISLEQMRTAEQEAQYVALQVAGYEPEIRQGEVIVQDVLCRVPSDDGLECLEFFPSDEQIDPADTILEVDGTPIATLDDLANELTGREPGDTLDMLIRRPQVGELEVTVELSASPDDPERTIIGFVPFDTATVDLPFDVDIDTGAVGGPSAGLAFTLALIDELTEGDLTGGRTIAVTGTISIDGTVGAIGGLEQKVHAVHQHGVQVFIVPASQFELLDADPDDPDDGVCRWECLNAAGDGEVVIVPVANLDEALLALEVLGGDPVVPVGSTDAT